MYYLHGKEKGNKMEENYYEKSNVDIIVGPYTCRKHLLRIQRWIKSLSKESLHPFTYGTSLTNCVYTVESPMEDLSPKRLDIKEVEPSDLRSYFDWIDIKKGCKWHWGRGAGRKGRQENPIRLLGILPVQLARELWEQVVGGEEEGAHNPKKIGQSIKIRGTELVVYELKHVMMVVPKQTQGTNGHNQLELLGYSV